MNVKVVAAVVVGLLALIAAGATMSMPAHAAHGSGHAREVVLGVPGALRADAVADSRAIQSSAGFSIDSLEVHKKCRDSSKLITIVKPGGHACLFVDYTVQNVPSGEKPTYTFRAVSHSAVAYQDHFTGSLSSYPPDSYEVTFPFSLAQPAIYRLEAGVSFGGQLQQQALTFPVGASPAALGLTVAFRIDSVQARKKCNDSSPTIASVAAGKTACFYINYTVKSVPPGMKPAYVFRVLSNGSVVHRDQFAGSLSSYAPGPYDGHFPFHLKTPGAYRLVGALAFAGKIERRSVTLTVR